MIKNQNLTLWNPFLSRECRDLAEDVGGAEWRGNDLLCSVSAFLPDPEITVHTSTDPPTCASFLLATDAAVDREDSSPLTNRVALVSIPRSRAKWVTERWERDIQPSAGFSTCRLTDLPDSEAGLRTRCKYIIAGNHHQTGLEFVMMLVPRASSKPG